MYFGFDFDEYKRFCTRKSDEELLHEFEGLQRMFKFDCIEEFFILDILQQMEIIVYDEIVRRFSSFVLKSA